MVNERKDSSRLKSVQDLSFRLGIQIKIQLEITFRTATFPIDTPIYEALYNYKPGMAEAGGQGGHARWHFITSGPLRFSDLVLFLQTGPNFCLPLNTVVKNADAIRQEKEGATFAKILENKLKSIFQQLYLELNAQSKIQILNGLYSR